MIRSSSLIALSLAVLSWLAVQPVLAATPDQILASIEGSAKTAPGFKGFSAANGEKLFKSRHANELSCASCHTEDPASSGKHAKTNKVIKPLAPSANAERLTDPAKVEKWFKRNCNDVFERACTAQEKGDVIAYLLTIKK